jgi:hypothetical protein
MRAEIECFVQEARDFRLTSACCELTGIASFAVLNHYKRCDRATEKHGFADRAAWKNPSGDSCWPGKPTIFTADCFQGTRVTAQQQFPSRLRLPRRDSGFLEQSGQPERRMTRVFENKVTWPPPGYLRR